MRSSDPTSPRASNMGMSTGKEKAPIEKVFFKVDFFYCNGGNFLRKVTDWGWIRGEKKVKGGFELNIEVGQLKIITHRMGIWA